MSEEERIRQKRIKIKKARRAAEAEIAKEVKVKKRHVSDDYDTPSAGNLIH